MKKFEVYGSLVLGCMASFLLGMFVLGDLHDIREVPTYKYVFVVLLIVFFIGVGLEKHKDICNGKD